MLVQSIFVATVLALGVNAAAVPADAKTFKFQVIDPKQGKWFLADATGAGTQDASKALDCTLGGTAGDVLLCGGKGFEKYPTMGDMFQMKATVAADKGSTGWTLGTDGTIKWTAKANINFDVGINKDTNLWAETCPDAHGHWTGPRGSAKAVYA